MSTPAFTWRCCWGHSAHEKFHPLPCFVSTRCVVGVTCLFRGAERRVPPRESPRLCRAARARRPAQEGDPPVLQKETAEPSERGPALNPRSKDHARVLERSWPPAPPQFGEAVLAEKGGLKCKRKPKMVVGGVVVGSEHLRLFLAVKSPQLPRLA